ncbi:cell division cycle-associated protein 2 [Xenentodon cancila]
MSTSEEDAAAVLTETSAPLNFSEITPSQFGISIESFTPKSLHSKDKSRLAQIKVRRRSSVGVRGSPETNSLIRFMAQQKMKTPPGSQTPELVKSSPFFPRVASTLRQKMASFQNLMDVVESDACDPLPVQDSNTGGRIRTIDNLSDGISCSEEKENNPPATPTPSKRRCLGLLEGCSLEIRQASAFMPCSSLKDQEEFMGDLMSSLYQDTVCELQSAGPPPSDDPAKAPPPEPSSPVHISVLEMKPTGKDDFTKKTSVKVKKQVRFGGPLSPELFDKTLPPSTPLQKGGTPARALTPGGNLQPRSVLKTPQRSESKTIQCRPDFLSPAGVGASPTLAMPRTRRMLSEGDDDDEINDGKSSTAIVKSASKAPEFLSLQTVAEEKPCNETQRSSRRKRKANSLFLQQPEETGPVKRLTRSAAKSACGKMKEASGASRRWNKDVDRSLYGSRAYASKNPTLSPISERLSYISQSPSAQQTSPVKHQAPNQGILISSTMVDDTQGMVGLSVTKGLENTSQDSVPSPSTTKRKVGRLSGSKVRRGLKKRKFSVPDIEGPQDLTGGEKEEPLENQTTSSLEVSKRSSSEHCESGAEEVNAEQLCTQTSVDASCTDSGKSEDDENLQPPTTDSPLPAEESGYSNMAQAKANRGRSSSALKELKNCAKECRTSCDTDENGHGDRADGQNENIQSIAGGKGEEGVANMDLAPWQDDFNFEDVFKPVATRGQRSVRRSLRNQSNTGHSSNGAGLAWLPRTSPDSIKETRRRTRGRRASAASLIQPVLEDTQDASLNELKIQGGD